jgi:hypothetical protein
MTQSALESKSLAQLLADSRVMDVQKAIVAALKTLFVGVDVRRHPGRMDIADFVAKDLYKPPAIAVAARRVHTARQFEGTFAVPVDWAAYVVAEDAVVGERRVERDEVAHAIGLRLLRIIHHGTAGRWGVAGITDPAADPEPEFKPEFTVDSFAKGLGLYAVTWRQGLIVAGDPLWDFDSLPPPDLETHTILSGDPDYVPDESYDPEAS